METTASEVVYTNMKEYAGNSQAHYFPSSLDGLTKVIRRIIWAAYPDRGSYLPLATLLTKARILHVAGDITIRTSADNHIQLWKTRIPIFDVEGIMGSYSGKSAGATRYIEACISDISIDLYFSKINLDTLFMIKSESGYGTEPLYFIPIIPTALLNNDKGIAIGFRFLNIPLNIYSVCELVKTYIRLNKENHLLFKRRELIPEIIQHLIPDPTIPGLLRNFKQIYLSYMKSDFSTPLVIDGVLEVTKNSIVINTIPHGSMLNIRERIEKSELPNSNSWISKNFSSFDDFTKDNQIAEHVLTVKRGVEPFKLLDKVKQMYGFTANIKSFPNWLNKEEKKEVLNSIQLLELWYKERFKSVLNKLRLEERHTINQIRKCEALIIASKHSDEIFKIFKNSSTPEEAALNVVKVFNELTIVQARFLFDFKYSDLTKINKESLLIKISELEKDLENIKIDILNIDTVIVRDVEFFQNKYGKLKLNTTEPVCYKGCIINTNERDVKIPTFRYVCKIRNIGFVQCYDIFDIKETFRSHGSDITLYVYPEASNLSKIYINLHGQAVEENDIDLPQTFAAKKYSFSFREQKNTVVINKDSLFTIKGIHYADELNIFYVDDTFVGLNSNGKLEELNLSNTPLRKTLNSSGNQTNIIYIINDTLDNMKDYYLVTMNKNIPNTLFIERVNNNSVSSIDKNEEIIYFGNLPEVLFSIDRGYNKTNNKHLLFKNIFDLFKKHNRVSINLSKMFISKEIKLQVKSLDYIKEITVI